MKAAVVTFPGSNCDRDLATAFERAGFDVARVMERPLDGVRLSGRGVSLVRQLGRNASWSDEGRSARVEFSWEVEA